MDSTVLRMVPYFKGLDEEIIEFIKNNSITKSVPKGRYIFYAEDKCTKLYIVKEGLIRVFLIGEDGREITVHYMEKGRFLGDTILFNEERYGANACAVEDSKLLVIENKTLEKVISRYPDVGIRMLADFGNRLKRMMKLFGEMTLSDVKKRLLRLLIELAKESGIERNGEVVLEKVPRQEEMAWRIGTAREVLCRELHKLEKEGAITVNRGRIIIHDIKKLKDKTFVFDTEEAVFPMRSL